MDETKQKKRWSSVSASTLRNVGISGGNAETVGRFGSADAEFMKAYRGVDNETGKRLKKGLASISRSKISTISKKIAQNNLKQQAGFSAEIQSTAQRNAENIINGRSEREIRTDDHSDFGANHPIYDQVVLDANGVVIPGSGSQMKFVNNTDDLLRKIAQGEGGGKADLSRYLDAKLDLPSEKVAEAIKFCEDKAKGLREQADRLDGLGKSDLAAKKRQQADNYDKVRGNVRDSGLTTREALFLRKHPELATAYSITRTSHRAGVKGAKIGAAIGGAISAVTNIFAVYQGDKEIGKAILDVAVDTGKAAAAGYGTAFVGSAVKGVVQQSASATTRTLAKTSLPTMAVTVCLELGDAVKRYVKGDIDGIEFFEVIGEKGSGLLASGMSAAIGQIAIPIPVVGGAIGGMIGYMLSSILYQDALCAFKEADQARKDYLAIKEYCEASRARLDAYREDFRAAFVEWLDEGRTEIAYCMAAMDAAIITGNPDDFASSANSLASLMGKKLQFGNRREFDAFMAAGAELVL